MMKRLINPGKNQTRPHSRAEQHGEPGEAVIPGAGDPSEAPPPVGAEGCVNTQAKQAEDKGDIQPGNIFDKSSLNIR